MEKVTESHGILKVSKNTNPGHIPYGGKKLTLPTRHIMAGEHRSLCALCVKILQPPDWLFMTWGEEVLLRCHKVMSKELSCFTFLLFVILLC